MNDDQTKWSEADWKAFIGGPLSRLADYASSPVKVGSFWMVANPHAATFNARLRAAGALPELACEEWEGALSVLASPGRIRISVVVFAFEAGHRTGPADQHWTLRYEGGAGPQAGRWRSDGWMYPDGPGEWGWIRSSGDCFFEGSLPVATESRHAKVELGPYRPGSALHPLPGNVGSDQIELTISLHSRASQPIITARPVPLVVWDEGPHWTTRVDAGASVVAIDLSAIAGSLPADAAEMVLRLDYLHWDEDYSRSALTRPFRIELR